LDFGKKFVVNEKKGFTAKDAKELAGLSYRRLHDSESRGAMPSERDKAGAWRKFTAKELFALMVVGKFVTDTEYQSKNQICPRVHDGREA
jgi:hypothetical protein